MDRREFLKTAALTAAGVALCGPGLLARKPASALRLTILHTNDVHSHLEPATAGTHAGLGGAPARAAFIASMRVQYPNLLLLDSGDILQGTPYFNLFDGEPEFRAMSAVRYDASTIGNHDFDAGIERLGELTRQHANFPFLCANYDFRNTPMAGLTRPWMVREIDGARIGLFGLGIMLKGLVPESLYGETRYLDPIVEATRAARHLRREEKCDFVICISHANMRAAASRTTEDYPEPGDRDLIRRVPEIDLILGGHNHRLLKHPERVRRPEGVGWIQQTGHAGTHIGVLHMDVYAEGKRELAAAGASPVSPTA